jgi:hypothetical protein
MRKNTNRLLLTSIVLILLACAPQSKICYIDNVQQNDHQYKYSFKQTEPRVLVETKKNDSIFHYHILDTIVEINQYIRNPHRKFQEFKLQMEKLKGRKYIPYFEPDSAFIYNSDKFEGQTCYCFAIERFCESNGVNPHPYFDSETLISSKTYHLILETLKSDRKSYPWKKFKRTKDRMPSEALIVLKCKGMFTHGIYYRDGLYYSKNGYSKPAVFPNLKSIVKSYRYTDTVLVYTPNKKKLLSFTESK